MTAVTTGGTSFPQTSDNRKRSEVIDELVEYLGDTDQPSARARAGRSLDVAVRYYNRWLWTFNVVTQPITLAANTSIYTLGQANIRDPLRCNVLDSNGRSVTPPVRFITYPEYEFFKADRRTESGTVPRLYTLRNIHEEGKVYFWPPLGATLTHPTVQLAYFRRIALKKGDNDRLDVPMEVEEGLFRYALYDLTLKERGMVEARHLKAEATEAAQVLLHDWQGFRDPAAMGSR